jgi:hypothetical protein
MGEPGLRHRIALIEEQVAELKIAIDDLRAERDACQAMAQAGFVWKRPMVMGALNRMRRASKQRWPIMLPLQGPLRRR